ncbi:MAG: outer membrane lipoprotein carrier protein LolA [Rikenellaceae bacterium]|nr:outer membrane lipoprotein carrier protein LolA [Rikenellaceae bacterium]
MKRRIINIAFLTVLALILTSSGMELRGQGKGKSRGEKIQRDKDNTEFIISQFSNQLMTLPAFEMGFSILLDGQNLVGTIQAEKNSYRLENKEMNLFCDGQTKWIHNRGNNEVVILKNDLTQVDLVENPMAFFTSLSKGYTYADKAKSSNYNNIPVWLIDLFPINKRLGYNKISLLVDKRNNAPVRIVYVMKNGESLAVNITKFVEQKPWGKDHFKFDPGKHKGLRVSDMR